MRIATTYDNGEIFQHFGQTSTFKVYEVEDKRIVSSEIIESDGIGHGALANLLADNTIDVLICGGIGNGAINALTEAGIEVCAGAAGDTDAVVEAYLKGEIEDAGCTCHHHDHEDGHDCGDGGCGTGGCGSSCGGCGHHAEPQILYDGKNAGKMVRVHYRGTLDDGSQFDSSYDRGETLDFTCGVGMMIPGFDKAVVDMNVGDVVDVHLAPAEAYGEVDPDNILVIEIAELPGSEELELGQQVYLTNPYGQPFLVTCTAKDETTVTLDANHELAGKALNFHIELVEVQ